MKNQWINDTLAFSENVPLALYIESELLNLPRVIVDIANSPEHSQLLQLENSDLVGQIQSLDQNLIEAFVAEHVRVLEDLAKLISEQNTDALLDERTYKDVRISISKQMTKAHGEHLKEFNNLRLLFRTVLPYLENRTTTALVGNCEPLYLAFRTLPAWEFTTLLFLHSIAKQGIQQNVEYDFLSDAWYFSFERIQEKIIAIGPVYRTPETTTSKKELYSDKVVRLRLLYDTFYSLFADRRITARMSYNSFMHSYLKRGLSTGEKISESIVKVSKVLRLFEIPEMFQGPIIVDELNRQDVEALTTTISLVSQLAAEIPYAKRICINPKQSSEKHSLCANFSLNKGEISEIELTRPETNDNLASIELSVPNSDSPDEKQLRSKITDLIYTVESRRRSSDSERVLILSDWLEHHFGRSSRIDDDIYDISNGNYSYLTGSVSGYIEMFTARWIAEIFRADVTTIWWINHAEKGRLELQSEYSKSMKVGILRREMQRKMNAAWGNIEFPYRGDDTGSFAYDSWLKRRFEPVDSFKPGCFIEYGDQCEECPKSGLVYPLKIYGRFLALVELVGWTECQFAWSSIHTMADLSNLLAPYLYRQHLFFSLSDVTATFQQQLVSDDNEQIDRSLADRVCLNLSGIFLSNMVNLWLRDRNLDGVYNLAGTTNRFYFSDEETREFEFFGDIADEKSAFVEHVTPEFGFRVGHYHMKDPTETNSHRGVTVDLSPKWAHFTELRRRIFVDDQHLEVMAFPIRSEEFERASYEVLDDEQTVQTNTQPIGYVVLHNFEFISYGPSWTSIVDMLSRQLALDLNRLNVWYTDEQAMRRAMLHEIRQDVGWIMGQVASLENPLNEITNTIAKIVDVKHTTKIGTVSDLRDSLESFSASVADARNTLSQSNSIIRTQALFSELQRELLELPSTITMELIDNHHRLNDISSLRYSETVARARLLDDKFDSLTLANPLEALKSKIEQVLVRKELMGLAASYRRRPHLEVEIATDIELRTSRVLFLQIVRNLLDNAFKYATPKTSVEITQEGWSRFNRRQWTLCFSNVGKRIDPRSNIFAPFVRATPTRRVGQGLGLFTVKVLSEILGSEVTHRQTALDDGNYRHEFRLLLRDQDDD